ncbi:bacterio-opsin activator domain-containing protein, partial [Natronoarchaeum mannanilyticum]
MAVPSAASDDGVELVFEIRDERYLFTTLSAELDCEVVARQIVQRSDGDLLEFFSVAGADPEAVTAFASAFPGVERARTIPRADDELLVEVVLSGPCLGAAIAD